jgi:hypothetical protein
LRIAPALAVVAAVLALVLPDHGIGALLFSLVSVLAIIARWWRRSVGQAAADGILLGLPVAFGAALAKACALDSQWECGIGCVAIGITSAIALAMTFPLERASGRERLTVSAFGAATAAAACTALGIGVALAASAATTATWAVVVVIRSRLASASS